MTNAIVAAKGDPSLVDRTIIVTGGSRGLGREMTLALIEAGARVAIVSTRESAQLAETVRSARSLGGEGRLLALFADIREPDACARVASEALQALGSIQVLINNAGLIPMATGDGAFWNIEPADWAAMVRTNVDGLFYMSHSVAPLMIAQGFGKIINLSTSFRTMVRENGSPYGPTKAFVEAASRIWAVELAQTGVTVNVLLPGGAVDTPADVNGRPTPDRVFLPASVVRVPALWLCSDASNTYTGRRFVGSLWNDALDLDARIAAAQEKGGEPLGML